MIELITELPNKQELLILSEQLDCRIYYNDYSYTVVKNNKDITVFAILSEYGNIISAKKAVAELLEIDYEQTKNTYASLARQVSDWLDIKDRPLIPRIELLPKWSYQKAIPCEMKNATSYDMKSAYWQIASRAPSLQCMVIPDRRKVVWARMSHQVEDKWERTKRILADHKKLRLAVIGVNSVNAKSNNAKEFLFKGEVKNITGIPPTNFQSLSLLTIRTAYELTQIQAEQIKAPYANADNVITEKFPHFWQQLGIIYGIKGSGNTDILGIGAYKCGDRITEPYKVLKPTETLNYLPPLNYYRCEYWEQVLLNVK